jgi:tRNA A37 threonylcarbamoyladenosine synthetase subunit TsaC/SUA5/YrdC
MSSSEIATRICKSAGTPISATSANISGEPPATSVEDVVGYFGDKIDLIIDGGVAAAPQCSTIVDITGDRIRVVRSGMVKIASG